MLLAQGEALFKGLTAPHTEPSHCWCASSTCRALRQAVTRAGDVAWRSAARRSGVLTGGRFRKRSTAAQLAQQLDRLRDGPQQVMTPPHTYTKLGAWPRQAGMVSKELGARYLTLPGAGHRRSETLAFMDEDGFRPAAGGWAAAEANVHASGNGVLMVELGEDDRIGVQLTKGVEGDVRTHTAPVSLRSAASWHPKTMCYAAFSQPGATGARRVLLVSSTGQVISVS